MFKYFPRVEYYVSMAEEVKQLDKIYEEVEELESDIRGGRSSDKKASELMDIIQACVTRLHRMEDDEEIDLEYVCESHEAKIKVRRKIIELNKTIGIVGDGRQN